MPSDPTPRPSRRRPRRLGLVVALVAIMLMGACNFGSIPTGGYPSNGVYVTDGRNWTVKGRDLVSSRRTAISTILNNEYGPTDLTISVDLYADSCSDSTADMCLFDAMYGDNDAYGWTVCNGSTYGSHPNQVCTLVYVRFNEYYTGGPSAKSLACHEIGHSVGLRHTEDTSSCVHTGSSEHLNAHDVEHLNSYY